MKAALSACSLFPAFFWDSHLIQKLSPFQGQFPSEVMITLISLIDQSNQIILKNNTLAKKKTGPALTFSIDIQNITYIGENMLYGSRGGTYPTASPDTTNKQHLSSVVQHRTHTVKHR